MWHRLSCISLLRRRCFKKYVINLLLDFGFAHYLLGETDAADNLRGSLLYMAPELLTRQQYNEKADLWSVGVILYGQFSYISATCIWFDAYMHTF